MRLRPEEPTPQQIISNAVIPTRSGSKGLQDFNAQPKNR
jgi:hypothetical protein